MSRERYQRGHVEKTGKRVRRWKCHYFTYHTTPEGQQKRVHHSFIAGPCATMTKTQAQRKLDETIQRKTGQTPGPDSRVTLEQFIRGVYLPVKEKQWAKNTVFNNRPLMRLHILPGLGGVALENLNKALIDRHMVSLSDAGAGRSTLERARAFIHAVLEEAVESGYLEKNPARKVSLKNLGRPPRPRRHLSIELVRHLLSSLYGKVGLVYRILLLCGLRISEVLALRWNDLGAGFLRVDESTAFSETKSTKSGRIREVPLPAQLAADLKAYRETSFFSRDEDFIFATKRGLPMYRQHARTDFQEKARKASGIQELTFQLCRRTFSTLIKPYAETKDIQAMLGHAQASTTLERYIQPVSESQKAAVERLERELFTIVH